MVTEYGPLYLLKLGGIFKLDNQHLKTLMPLIGVLGNSSGPFPVLLLPFQRLLASFLHTFSHLDQMNVAFSFHLRDFTRFTHSPAPILNLVSEVFFGDLLPGPSVLSAAPNIIEPVINIVS